MANVDLATKLELVTDYYGAGTIWDRMSIDGLSVDQINAMYNQLPASSFTVDRTPSGLNLGRNYSNPFELPTVPGTDFDSNIQGGSYGGGNTFTGNVPANLEVDPNTGLPVRQTAGPTTAGGSTLAAIADRVALAVAGVNIGAKLGLKIDELLYNSDPSFWNNVLPTVNPQTWNSLVGQSPVGDFFLRTLFGITGNNMTGYISEEMLAYYYQMMRDGGFFGGGGAEAIPPTQTTYPNPFPGNIKLVTGNVFIQMNIGNYDYIADIGNAKYMVPLIWNGTYKLIVVSDEPFTVYQRYINKATQQIESSQASQSQSMVSSLSGNTYYYVSPFSWGVNYIANLSDLLTNVNNPTSNPIPYNIPPLVFDGTIRQTGGQEGVTPLPQATQYPPTNITGTTPQEVLNQLKQQYPQLFDGSVTERTMQDDGSITETTYVPIPWVTDGLNPEQPTTTDGRDQTSTDVDEQTGQDILPTTPTDQQTQPPDTGDGSTPPVVVPTGSASSLWAVYNPSQGELNSFGAWLWSSNFVDQIKKLFADPMQAIIGVHKVFATPHTSGSQTIKCGYLDSGVSAAVVSNQYTTVDCGSASLREYFGNVFDYDPFTKVSIFLPFIGIVPLNTADVMRSTVSVKYTVDVITGACLAEVSISRDGGGGILYTYGGSAIVTYPVSSGSYVGAVQAALSTAIGIGSAIASGGASLGASAGMVLGGLSHARTQVQHSGQFSGSSGAMGGKKPYLIVSRPQTRTPTNIGDYKGKPSNSIHKLSSCTGFVKVNEVHVISTSAYDNEIQEIESLLKSGVIF